MTKPFTPLTSFKNAADTTNEPARLNRKPDLAKPDVSAAPLADTLQSVPMNFLFARAVSGIGKVLFFTGKAGFRLIKLFVKFAIPKTSSVREREVDEWNRRREEERSFGRTL